MTIIKQLYITPQLAWHALTKARQERLPVFISGMTGYGKTELIKNFFIGKTYIYYSPKAEKSEKLDKFARHINPKRKSPLPVVFDDIQSYRDEESRAKIISIASRNDVFPIFISRPEVIDWLVPFKTTREVISIEEKDLAFADDQIKEYLEKEKIQADAKLVKNLQKFIDGNPYALKIAAINLHENPDPDTIIQRLTDFYTKYIYSNVTKDWDENLHMYFTKLSVVDTFTIELAEHITGEINSRKYVDQIDRLGNIFKKNGSTFIIRSILLATLRKKALELLPKQEIQNYALQAAAWYENHDDPEKAIKIYYENNRIDGVKKILMQNSAQNPDNGHYIGLLKYYFKLDEKVIESETVLMSGMAMVCSMCAKIEESEKWYAKLKQKESELSGAEKAEARRKIAYLDIALPHRGSKKILDIMKSLSTLLTSKRLALPEFSVTSNLPSVMNGGKDFSHWAIKDRAIAKNYGHLFSIALGRHGRSLVNLALGESLYEKAEDDAEVLSCLSRGQLEAELDGNLEMGFVAAGLMIRFYLTTGRLETAELQYESFERKITEQKAFKFLPNLKALKCRIALQKGDESSVLNWVEYSAPDETEDFIAMLRYQYLTKIRCYISMKKLNEAFSLIEKIKWYAKFYDRTYISLECKVLASIVLFNRKDPKWRTELQSLLDEAEEFSFTRVISDEGAAILPLLSILRCEYEAAEKQEREKAKLERRRYVKKQDKKRDWLLHIIRTTERMCSMYPKYCKMQAQIRSDFSPNALKVFQLQLKGLSATQIAQQSGLNYENVRYHIKQNYKKIGVRSKKEALAAARDLGYI